MINKIGQNIGNFKARLDMQGSMSGINNSEIGALYQQAKTIGTDKDEVVISIGQIGGHFENHEIVVDRSLVAGFNLNGKIGVKDLSQSLDNKEELLRPYHLIANFLDSLKK